MRTNTAVVGLGWMLIGFAAMNARAQDKEATARRAYLLELKGDNTVTFVPQAGIGPIKIDYEAEVSYYTDIRNADDEKANDPAKKKKSAARKSSSKSSKRKGEEPSMAATSAFDVSIHSAESRFRQNGQIVLESKVSRSSFQGRLQPDAAVVGVTARNAPAALQAILRTFDTPIAVILLDDEMNTVGRKVRENVPMHAIAATLLSLHTPVPRGLPAWDAPTQLAMGHGQTAKGTLHFEKIKESLEKTGGLVNVKVSGVLKAEGVVVGKLIKDGTYTVKGEQAYDAASRAWKTARWEVVVSNELANANGATVARALGNMTVTSHARDAAPTIVKP